MKRSFSLVLVRSGLAAAIAFSAVHHTVRAQDAKEQPRAGDVLKLEAKKEKAAPIPDFARVYGVPFESFQTVGNRLAEVRERPTRSRRLDRVRAKSR